LYLFTWKIAPALASGNCVVAKPSEITPMTAYLLSELAIEAGIPAGVLNIVHGYGTKVGKAIVSHPKIQAISFTGGTKTGEEISRIAAPMFKKLSLELGGKNPNIIFADCDFDKAVKTSVRSSFANQGEICLCGSRMFVERNIYERFKTAFVAEVKKLKTGDPMDDSNWLGAIVSKPHMEKILHYIELAKQEGGTILTGGERIHPGGLQQDGYYIAPTVIEGLPYDCRTNQEEIFGPVLTIQTFRTDDEVIEKANNTAYGLSAGVWTDKGSKIFNMTSKLRAGVIWANTFNKFDPTSPFGGYKESGFGREGGVHGLSAYLKGF